MIQSSFDEGYEDGARFSLLSCIKSAILNAPPVLNGIDSADLSSENSELIKLEIEKMSEEISAQIPEIKIATLLQKGQKEE